MLSLVCAPVAFAGDFDQDGIADSVDNCVAQFNALQLDGDGDGAGNACDGDFNNDGVVDAADTQMLQDAVAGGSCSACDMDESGFVNARDFLLHARMIQAAGS